MQLNTFMIKIKHTRHKHKDLKKNRTQIIKYSKEIANKKIIYLHYVFKLNTI